MCIDCVKYGTKVYGFSDQLNQIFEKELWFTQIDESNFQDSTIFASRLFIHVAGIVNTHAELYLTLPFSRKYREIKGSFYFDRPENDLFHMIFYGVNVTHTKKRYSWRR